MKKLRNVFGYTSTALAVLLVPAGGLAISGEASTPVVQAAGHGAVVAGGALALVGHRLLSRKSAGSVDSTS